MDLTWILSIYNLAIFIARKACNMPKVLKLYVEEVYDLQVSAFTYSLPDLHKSAPSLNWQQHMNLT